MTIKNADLIRAVLDGKKFQWRAVGKYVGQWREWNGEDSSLIEDLLENSPDYEYRIAPKVRSIWLLVNKCGAYFTFDSRPQPDIVSGKTLLRHDFDAETGEFLDMEREVG